MPSTTRYVALTAILAGSADAFVAPAPLGLQSRRGRTEALGSLRMVLAGADKPGTGENRMTKTSFNTPLVEKQEFPGSIHGYQVGVTRMFCALCMQSM